MTTNTDRIRPFQILLEAADTGLADDCKAQAEQARSVDVQRIGKQVDSVPTTALGDLDEALRVHLAL